MLATVVSGLALAVIIAVAPAASIPAPAAAPHSRVELVAATEAVVPGERLWLGLHFAMDPGWHIYWVNPGDSGEPPTVQWNLPAGFHAGRLAWPVPMRLGHGSIIDYGYEREVMLLAPIEPPAKVAPDSRVRVAAKVEWLVCRDICIPAKQNVQVDLPVAQRAVPDPATRALFRGARDGMPLPEPRGWRVMIADEGSYFALSVVTGRREEAALFFPLVPDQVSNAKPQQVNPLARGVRLTLWKSDLLAKRVEMLNGLLDLGRGRAYVISAPVRRASR